MKDLKVYYVTDKGEQAINPQLDKVIEIIAVMAGLTFSGSGVELETKIRDIHYTKRKGKK